MSFSIEINGTKAIMAKLDRAIEAVGSPRKALQQSGEFLVQEFKENFGAEGARLNEAWAQLAESTLREKRRLGFGNKGILERTGRLQNSFEMEVGKFSVRVFNLTPYFQYHQRGGANLPRRRMIIATKNVKAKIYEIFNLFVRDALK